MPGGDATIYALAPVVFVAATTFVGVNGTLRSRTPMASKTALEMAGAGNTALEELVMALSVRRDHHHVELANC